MFDKLALQVGIGAGDKFVVQAESEHRVLQSVFPNAQIAVTPHPTYEALGAAQTKLPIELPEDRPILLFCGLVRHYKGLDILLDALPAVLEQKSVHLAVVGEFWEDEQNFRDQIDRLGIGTAVSIVNRYVENEVLSAFLHRADGVVLPYRSATQSGVAQLALGHGVPVITTAVGGLADIVAETANSAVVPPEDPSALADAIIALLTQESSNEAAAKDDVADGRFSWTAFVKTIENLSSPL